MKNIDNGMISNTTASIVVNKLYMEHPNSFNMIQQKNNNNKMNEIDMQLKQMTNPMAFFIMCSVLNISFNKQKQLIKLSNIHWSNDQLVQLSSMYVFNFFFVFVLLFDLCY